MTFRFYLASSVYDVYEKKRSNLREWSSTLARLIHFPVFIFYHDERHVMEQKITANYWIVFASLEWHFLGFAHRWSLKTAVKLRWLTVRNVREYAKATFDSNKILLRAALRKKLRLSNQSSSELRDSNKLSSRNEWRNVYHHKAQVRTHVYVRRFMIYELIKLCANRFSLNCSWS